MPIPVGPARKQKAEPSTDSASQVASSDWGELTFSVGAYPLGPYYLQVYGTPTWYYIAARGVEPDSYETADDDYALMSNPIVIDGGIQSHTIHANGNQDWMWFTAVFGQTYHIETSNHSGMELHLCLYDAAGVPSMSSIRDQDSRDEVSMVMKWTADGEGTYYIMVESFGSLGDYDIEIRTAPAIVSVIADDPDDGDTAYGIGDTITITFDMDTNQPPYGTNPGAWMDLNFDLGAGETFGDTADGFTLTWTDPRTLVITVNGVSSSTLSLGDTITVLSAAGLTSATGTVTCTDTSPPIVGDWGIFSIYITVTSPTAERRGCPTHRRRSRGSRPASPRWTSATRPTAAHPGMTYSST